MCIFGGGKAPKLPKAAPIPAADNGEARREADIAAQLMRRRRGVAANILTGPAGIQSDRAAVAQLGTTRR